MKNKICMILLLFIPFMMNAQQDKKAQQVLNGVSAKYKSLASVKAEFSILIENASDKSTDKQKGSIILKGKKYILEVANQQIVNDGKTNWTWLKEANEIQISDATESDDAISPATIFTMYEKGFAYRFVDETTLNGKAVINIELTPTDKTKKIFKIKLTIDKNEKMVISAKVFDKNGNHYTYSIDKLTPNFSAQDAIFVMDPKSHPKAEVVDMR